MIGVIDGHNDLAWASREKRGYRVDGLDGHLDGFHTDIPRLRAGGVTAQFWSLWVDPVLQGAEQVTATLEQIDFVHRLVAAYPRDFVFARTAHDVREATASARIGCLMGAEGGDQIDVPSHPAQLRANGRALHDADVVADDAVGRFCH